MPTTSIAHRSGLVATTVRELRLIAVLRRVEPRERLLALVDDLAADGIRLFEITFDGPDAAADLAAVRDRLGVLGVEGAAVGAGTIRTADQLRGAIAVRAAFGVSPVLDLAIVDAAFDAGLAFVPGVYSPTEVDLAWRAGATFVKVFPGSSLGPGHVRELLGPLPEVEMIVSGGVDATNAASFLAAGAVAVGIGSAIGRMASDERRALVTAVRMAR